MYRIVHFIFKSPFDPFLILILSLHFLSTLMFLNKVSVVTTRRSRIVLKFGDKVDLYGYKVVQEVLKCQTLRLAHGPKPKPLIFFFCPDYISLTIEVIALNFFHKKFENSN